MTFLSIFTPTYNRAHCLANLFDSLCAQTDRDFEWIINDDGSIDDTEALVNRFKEKDSVIKNSYKLNASCKTNEFTSVIPVAYAAKEEPTEPLEPTI